MHLGKQATVHLKEVLPIRPRATTARQCFGDAFSAEINEQLEAECKRTGASSKENLPIYYRIRDEMYDAAGEEVQAKYEEEANAFNVKVRGPPDKSEIYTLQKDIATDTALALKRLCGWDWGGHGNTVFFVLGAYQDENSDIVTFSSTVSSECQVENFRIHIPDIQKELWDRFRGFVSSTLPYDCLATTAMLSINDSAPQQGANLEHHIPSSPQADSDVNNDSEHTIGTPALALTMPNNDSNSNKILGSRVTAIDMLRDCSPIPPSTSLVDCPQRLNLTDEQMALAITMALSAASPPNGPAVAQEQEQPPKAKRKHHVKKAAGTSNLAKLPPVLTAQIVKRKCQERVPSNFGPPIKKTKVLLEPGKWVSARLHANGYKNAHVNIH
ncbi:hypothetical protein AX14_008573 [Amanita brunnescens Koide BX004]|nr:hypothetical protein AX14_008573 [Amanita brunnescens Koide BX004]